MHPTPYPGDPIPRLRTILWTLVGALVLSALVWVRRQAAAAPSRIELWLETGQLELAPEHHQRARPLLEEDFSAGSSRWMAWSRAGLIGLGQTGASLEVGPFAGTGIELSGRRGGISILVPVQPASALRFRGAVWIDGIQPEESESTALMGRFCLQEMEGWPRNAALLPQRVARFGARELVLESPSEERRWMSTDTTLWVGPRTNALLITCLLSRGVDLNSGVARFRSIALEAIPLNEHWHRELSGAAERMRHTPGPTFGALAEERRRQRHQEAFPSRAAQPEFAHRRVFLGQAGDEPGIVLLPGERVLWSLRVPRGEPVLRFGLGPWVEGDPLQQESPSVAAIVALRVNGKTIEKPVVAGETSIPCRFDLGPWKGERVRLELCATGDWPVALERPEIVPLGAIRTGAPQTALQKVQARKR